MRELKKRGYLIMTNFKELDELFDRIITVNDLEHFTAEVDQSIESMYDLMENNVNLKNHSELEERFSNIKERARKIPVLTIFTAVSLRHPEIAQIADWLKRNVKNKVLLNVVLDSSILGGAVLLYKGIYKDFSLISEVNKLHKKNGLRELLK